MAGRFDHLPAGAGRDVLEEADATERYLQSREQLSLQESQDLAGARYVLQSYEMSYLRTKVSLLERDLAALAARLPPPA